MSEAGTDEQTDPQAAFSRLLQRSVVRMIGTLTGAHPCHLVGGALRDAVLGVPARDIDVVVAGRGRALAHALAETYSTRVIELGGDRFAAFRVLAGTEQIDLWDRGTESLETDLRRRDLSIHAFAVELSTGAIIDPFDGLTDLARKTLRMTTASAFARDPLRVLRLCRFAATLPGFEIHPATLRQAALAAPDLERVASERIRAEFDASLMHARGGTAVRLWIRTGVLPDALLGVTTTAQQRRRLDSNLKRAFEACDQTAGNLSATGDLQAARAALTWWALGETLGVSSSTVGLDLLRRGYQSREAHRQAALVGDAPPPPKTAPEQRWYLHSMGSLWSATLGFAAGTHAVDSSTRSPSDPLPSRIAQLIELAVTDAGAIFDPPRLITGQVLQSELGVEPGPGLGRMLEVIRRRQIEGSIATRGQAVELAKRLLSDSP